MCRTASMSPPSVATLILLISSWFTTRVPAILLIWGMSGFLPWLILPAMYDSYVVIISHLSLMPCIRTRLWRVWSDRSDRCLGIICPYSIWHGLHPLEYQAGILVIILMPWSRLPTCPDHRGTTCLPLRLPQRWLGDRRHEHICPSIYILGWRETDVLIAVTWESWSTVIWHSTIICECHNTMSI